MNYSTQDFNKKTILITGGAGFIGSNLALYFQNNYPDSKIVVFDIFRNESLLSNGNLKSFGHYKNLIEFNGEVICGDINSKNDLIRLKNYKFDFIFHNAAISDTRVYDQELIMQTNLNSFYDLLELAKTNNSKLIYASSAAVYGNGPSPQLLGQEKPNNPYAYSKYMMDKVAINFSKKYSNISVIGLRFFNVYGRNEFFKGKTASVVIQFGHQILNGQAPTLFKESDKIFRDFIYIKDVIQACIKSCDLNASGIFNVGTGISRSFQDIANILQNEFGTNLGNNYIENPYNGYQSNTQADITNSRTILDFNPIYSLEEGIAEYLPEISRLHGKSNI
jgi:ADP-L-glycero-D-manno-heptose 6-epimerase